MSSPCKTQPGTPKANTQMPKLNDVLHKLTYVCYMTLIEASSGYHSLKLNWKIIPNHLCMSVWWVQICQTFIEVLPEGDIFQQILMKYSNMPSVFGRANGILIVGYDADEIVHDKNLRQVKKICCQENFKLNKKQLSFQVHQDTVLWGHDIQRRSATRSKDVSCANWNVPLIRKNYIHF